MTELTYEPLDAIEPTEVRPLEGESIDHRCRCERIYPDAHVVNGPPAWCTKQRVYFVIRRLYCDHCQHVICWTERCGKSGDLLGVRLTDPVVLKGPKYIRAFLSAYPHAAGVLQ